MAFANTKPSKLWLFGCGFELNLEIVLFVVNLIFLLVFALVFDRNVNLESSNDFAHGNVTDPAIGAFNCRLFTNNLQYSNTFTCVDYRGATNDSQIRHFTFGVEFKKANLLFSVVAVVDPTFNNETAQSIGPKTFGIKLSECDFMDRQPAVVVIKYRSSECPQNSSFWDFPCKSTLGFGGVGLFNGPDGNPYQMWTHLTTEGGEFDVNVLKLSLRLFDFQSASETDAWCDLNAQSALAKDIEPFDANNESRFNSSLNFFRGIKAHVCKQYFRASTYSCSFRTTESLIEFILRISGYLLFVQLVLGVLVILLKFYYSFFVEDALDEEKEKVGAIADNISSTTSKQMEFQSARMDS